MADSPCDECPSFPLTVDVNREFVIKYYGSYYRFFLHKKTWAAVLPVIIKGGNSNPNKLQMQDLIRIKEPAKQNPGPITVCKDRIREKKSTESGSQGHG